MKCYKHGYALFMWAKHQYFFYRDTKEKSVPVNQNGLAQPLIV